MCVRQHAPLMLPVWPRLVGFALCVTQVGERGQRAAAAPSPAITFFLLLPLLIPSESFCPAFTTVYCGTRSLAEAYSSNPGRHVSVSFRSLFVTDIAFCFCAEVAS